jgi:hypothetical protein
MKLVQHARGNESEIRWKIGQPDDGEKNGAVAAQALSKVSKRGLNTKPFPI